MRKEVLVQAGAVVTTDVIYWGEWHFQCCSCTRDNNLPPHNNKSWLTSEGLFDDNNIVSLNVEDGRKSKISKEQIYLIWPNDKPNYLLLIISEESHLLRPRDFLTDDVDDTCECCCGDDDSTAALTKTKHWLITLLRTAQLCWSGDVDGAGATQLWRHATQG